MTTISIKSRHIDMNTKSGSISISYDQFKMFKLRKHNYLVINEKTYQTVRKLNFDDIESYIYMYRFIDSETHEIKHTPCKHLINGKVTHSFMVCNF